MNFVDTMFEYMKNIVLLVVLILIGCTTPVETTSPVEDYSLVMFGESGAALSGMMKPQSETQPTDGSTAFRLPPALQLTQEQRINFAKNLETRKKRKQASIYNNI